MYCENCGNKLNEGDKFCTKCGVRAAQTASKAVDATLATPERWWLRLLKVFYILMYLPLPLILWAVWDSYGVHSYYSSYSKVWNTYGDDGEAFWHTLLTLLVYIVVVRLIKIATLYVAMGKRPQWKTEFKKLF